jgi:hypothetical protein
LDFGRAKGLFQQLENDEIYYREFERGYVYVNPGWADYYGIKMPVNSYLLDINMDGDQKKILNQKFDIRSHEAVFIAKGKEIL